jgi:YfiH family protein
VNRRRAAAALGLPAPESWVWLDPVHGADAISVTGPGTFGPADAAVTAAAGLPLAVVTADCAPVALLAGAAVGVVHAGWQGLLAGVVAAALDRLRDIDRSPARAVIGPCIRAPRYEFGAEGLDVLVARFGAGVASETEWGTPAFDLPGALTVALREAGVDDVVDSGICTAADPSLFSYRADGRTGRQAVVAWIEDG